MPLQVRNGVSHAGAQLTHFRIRCIGFVVIGVQRQRFSIRCRFVASNFGYIRYIERERRRRTRLSQRKTDVFRDGGIAFIYGAVYQIFPVGGDIICRGEVDLQRRASRSRRRRAAGECQRERFLVFGDGADNGARISHGDRAERDGKISAFSAINGTGVSVTAPLNEIMPPAELSAAIALTDASEVAIMATGIANFFIVNSLI